MKLFTCQNCGQVLFFENQLCNKCGHQLGFLPTIGELSALEPSGDGQWRALADSGSTWVACENAQYNACNWMVPAGSGERFCAACRHNRTVPDLTVADHLLAWRKMEGAKHHLFYTLMRLRLPIPNRVDKPQGGLVFDFLADPPASQGGKVMTGHDEGLITVAVAEADDAQRETRRTAMHEPYRTLLGHFRHEVGHYYWDVLVRDGGELEACRAVFGDERPDYNQALQRHYQQGAPPNWQASFVSAYATSHPWEDWAETWAHYLHIVDSVDTSTAFGIAVHPQVDPDAVLQTDSRVDAYSGGAFDRLIEVWMPLTIALNAMNRSMGLGDLYPFVLSTAVIQKMSYIHNLVHKARASG